MKMAGAAFSRSGSINSFGEPPPGIEMLSTPPATMQSAPSERIELAAIAMVCRPDEQKRLTDTPAVDLRHAREQCGLAADIGRAMGAIAEIAVLDVILVDAGALHGVLDGVGCHRHRRSDVEPAAAGLRQPGSRIRNNNRFTHFLDLPLKRPLCPAIDCKRREISLQASKISPVAGLEFAARSAVRKELRQDRQLALPDDGFRVGEGIAICRQAQDETTLTPWQ